jgi:hypothetical protein
MAQQIDEQETVAEAISRLATHIKLGELLGEDL